MILQMATIRKLYISVCSLLNILLVIKVIKQQKDTSSLQTFHVNSVFSDSSSTPKHLLKQSIAQARQSIDIPSYNFDEPTITKSIKKANQRGVHIRILIDAKKATQTNVADIIHQLMQAGIPVRLHTSEKMHLKMAIIDQRTLVAGSFNYTNASVHENLEQLFKISNQKEAQKWAAVFNELWRKHLK